MIFNLIVKGDGQRLQRPQRKIRKQRNSRHHQQKFLYLQIPQRQQNIHRPHLRYHPPNSGNYRSHKSATLLALTTFDQIDYCSEIRDYSMNFRSTLQSLNSSKSICCLMKKLSAPCPPTRPAFIRTYWSMPFRPTRAVCGKSTRNSSQA